MSTKDTFETLNWIKNDMAYRPPEDISPEIARLYTRCIEEAMKLLCHWHNQNERIKELTAACRDLLPHAEREIQRLNSTLVGGLYPAINLAVIERAEAAIAKAKEPT